MGLYFEGTSDPAAPAPEREEKASDPNGRPLFKKDDKPRKRRVDNPKSKPGVAELIVWSDATWSKVSDVVNTAYLNTSKASNLRRLTKQDVKNIEKLKLDIFTNLDVLSDVSQSSIIKVLKSGLTTPKLFSEKLHANNISLEEMPIDTYRKHVVGTFIAEHIE